MALASAFAILAVVALFARIHVAFASYGPVPSRVCREPVATTPRPTQIDASDGDGFRWTYGNLT